VTYTEVPVWMACASGSMLGIVSQPETPRALGVVIAVGGAQYRVGSHRQFLLLARSLASAGFAVLRFDYPGMGDSLGQPRSFESVDAELGVAMDALQRTCPAVRRVVLWGLCDAASAVLLYSGQHSDARLAGLCLLNPWVRSEATLARTRLKHYYSGRLRQPDFWRSIWQGQFAWQPSLRALWHNLQAWRQRPRAGVTFQRRMALALRHFKGPVLLVLGGCDYTAKEFLECAQTDADWRGLLAQPGLTRLDVADADHTFSRAAWRCTVEQALLHWLQTLETRA